MSRRCARSTCSNIAVATLSYSYGDRVVWVEGLTDEAHPMIHDLCEVHASSVNVPQGWVLCDERDEGSPAPDQPASSTLAPKAQAGARRSVKQARLERIGA